MLSVLEFLRTYVLCAVLSIFEVDCKLGIHLQMTHTLSPSLLNAVEGLPAQSMYRHVYICAKEAHFSTFGLQYPFIHTALLVFHVNVVL